MVKKNVPNQLLIPSVLFVVQLVFLFSIKYLNQNLSLNNFSPLKLGNLLNLILYTAIILGMFFISRKSKGSLSKKSVTFVLITSWSLLSLAFISTKIRIISESFFIFNQPGDKVLTSLLFSLFLLTILSFLIYLWYQIFNGKKPSFITTTITIFVIPIVFFILTIVYIDNAGYTSGRWAINKNKKNVAVVLGAAVWSGNIPSPTLSARVDKALELIDNGFVGRIVLTGGKAPGELPESEVAYAYAKSKGADISVLNIEKMTSSTSDQIMWIKTNLSNDDSVSDIILVSDAYHLPRAIEISKFFNVDVKVAESFHKINFKDLIYNKIRESIALFNFWNFAL